MSDDILEVQTSYGDVAELGAGWVDRVDGERIVLAFERSTEPGAGVRYVVHLADGTPAFAGAGRCLEVVDRGDDAPAGVRYVTQLDALQFDELSQPV